VLVRNFWRRKKGEFIARSSGFSDTKSGLVVSAEVQNPWRTSTAALLFEGLWAIGKLL
jgi:hypothetical protein